MAFNAHAVRGTSTWKGIFPPFFSFESKNAEVLFENSLACIVKCNCSGRDNEEFTEGINSLLLKTPRISHF